MATHQESYHQSLIRQKLNGDKVKLWLPPYTNEDGSKGEMPGELPDRYSAELKLPRDEVLTILEDMRLHAVEKLATREKFKQSGLATLSIKLAGQAHVQGKHTLSIEIALSATGIDLKQEVFAKTDMPTERLKLICSGHVLDDGHILHEQGVKNGSQVLVLCLGHTEALTQKADSDAKKVAKTREAAELLSQKMEDQSGPDPDFYLQIADQTGKPLQLPPEEHKALCLAMTLHEKGRASLKRKEYSESLLLLLEADKEFSKCRADILNAVDNYAILCLDVVWCYLCLKNVDQLPDAEKRLQNCEEVFERSYGRNLERLAAVKGGTSTEQALFMKLHLLQAIVAFHQHQYLQAGTLFSMAERELSELKVDDEKLTQVVCLGFHEREARLALRAARGNVDMAVEHIMKRREERHERKKKEREEKRKKSLRNSLGKTANGEWVNADTYEMLLTMGFGKGAAREALRQTNNNLNMSLEVLQTNPALLSLPDPDPPKLDITDEMIAQVTALGFDVDIVKAVLQHCHGSIEHAVDELSRSGGSLPNGIDLSFIFGPSGRNVASTSNSAPVKSPEEQQKEQEAMDTIVPDIPKDEEEYLDINLQDEEAVLIEYKTIYDYFLKIYDWNAWHGYLASHSSGAIVSQSLLKQSQCYNEHDEMQDGLNNCSWFRKISTFEKTVSIKMNTCAFSDYQISKKEADCVKSVCVLRKS